MRTPQSELISGLMKPAIATVCACLLLLAGTGRGDVASDMTAFVDAAGGATTSTPASIYQGQSRGYINGGRLFVRTPARNYQLYAYKAPKITAGCGGIDAFGGSFSFLNAAEITNMLKQVGTGAGSYALMLGLRTVSSQIANTIEENFGWLRDKIDSDISTCEAAANVVGVGMDFLGINNKEMNLCIIRKMESSAMDYSAAKVACGGDTKLELNDPETKKNSFVDGNLVWKILAETQMFAGDNDMKMLAMSLTGTIVKHQVKIIGGVETTVATADNDSQSKTDYYPSLLLTDPGIIDALLYGATVTRYSCTDNLSSEFGCKNVTRTNWTLSPADSLVEKTRSALRGLYEAIRNRTDPDAGAINYVATTSIPSMRIVRTAALLGDNGLGLQIIDDYAEQIAIELLYTYITSIANNIQAQTYQASMGEDGAKLREGIDKVIREIKEIRESAEITVRKIMLIAEQMQYYERILISALPQNITRAYAWSAGGGH